MKRYHSNSIYKQMLIKNKLVSNGLTVDHYGQLKYGKGKMKIDADAVYLMRHGETYATQERVFMSNDSKNSHLCRKGIEDILSMGEKARKYNFDIVIICSDIPRVRETANLFRSVCPDLTYIYAKKYKGIDNAGWEGLKPDDLTDCDHEDYIEREEKRNIFAKSSKGGSWGEVLANVVDLIHFINKRFAGKRILLISQGSILQALILLTHMTDIPWEKYDTGKLYNLDATQEKSNYGKIVRLFDERMVV